MSLEIKPIKCDKDGLKDKEHYLSKCGALPKINTCTIICGSAGSGKTNLLNNILTNENMYKDYFNDYYVLSETGDSDEVLKSIGVKEENIYTDLEEGIEKIGEMMKIQKKIIKAVGADKAPQICLIFDDCINNRKLLKHKVFHRCFIMNRHHNLTIFLLSQYLKKIPPLIRTQSSMIYFQGSLQNDQQVAEIYAPPAYSIREFLQMIKMATKEKYSFMFINKHQPMKTRYRIKFDKIIRLDRLE